MDPETKAALAYEWRRWIARPNQLAPPGDWVYWLVLAGRGFGKTRIGAEWVREKIKTLERVALIGKDATDMRSVMIEGESGIMAVCPPWERPEYLPSRRMLRWPNGAISEFRTGEDPEGVRGLQCQALWADEIAAWQYPQETWDMAVLGLRLPPHPEACITTTPKTIRLIKSLIANPNCAVTRGSTYDNLSNLAPAFRDQVIVQYEGTRLGRQELLGELLEDEGLAYSFSELTHVFDPFEIPQEWERFEFMDFGSTNPTAWYVAAVDYEGNILVFDEYYSPGLVSEHADRIIGKRQLGWEAVDELGQRISNPCFGDPSMKNRPGTSRPDKPRNPTSIEAEFADFGITFVPANNDRRAGYLRLSELFRMDNHRFIPEWSRLRPGDPAPQLYISERCPHLIEQIQDAMLDDEKERFPGEAVSEKWEGAHGHAHAALRYGMLSRPLRSDRSERIPHTEDERKLAFLDEVQANAMRRHELYE